ncbi:MAG: hypothetical protein R2873_19840 [Caldilineaceae bacterium]
MIARLGCRLVTRRRRRLAGQRRQQHCLCPRRRLFGLFDVAKNVSLAEDRLPQRTDPVCAVLDCEELRIYSFELDSRAYAEQLTLLARDQMLRTGQLTPASTVQIPEHLANTRGDGELWVDGRGLPVRQLVTLSIPPVGDADYRTTAEMDIRFTNYAGVREEFAFADGWQRLLLSIGRMRLPEPIDVALGFSTMLLAVIGMAV